MTSIELDYICDVCSRPVRNGDGALYLSFSDLHERRRTKAEWDTVHDSDEDGVSIVTLLGLPASASWRIHHDACRPDGVDGYDISVEQVRTWRDLLAWTAHLMDKNWLPDTDWRTLIGNAAGSRDRRIVELTRGDAA